MVKCLYESNVSLSLSKLPNAFGDYFVLYIILEHIVSVALYSEFVYFSNRSYLQVHYLFPLPRLHPLSNSNLLEIPFFITSELCSQLQLN